MNKAQLQKALRDLGWPVTTDGQFRAAIWDFQRGFAFYNLSIDGVAGPRTLEAVRHSLRNGGRASRHFAFREFKSKGNGWIKVDRNLLRGLDRYRASVGGPVRIVSGYRDPAHNKRVGGATNSQHMYGRAVDVPGARTLKQVRSLKAFTGIGIRRRDGRVLHVDVRKGPSVNNPTTWFYG